jgi:hypothetical protein
MTIAVCFNCGEFKHGAFNPCPKCGEVPEGEEKNASMALTDHYHNREDLMALSAAIKVRNKKTHGYKTHDQLATELIAIYGSDDLTEPYSKLYPDDSPERNRFYFTAFIFILSASPIIASKCKNPDMASMSAACHQTMLDWWDGAETIVRIGDYIITDDEYIRFIEHLKNTGTDLDLRNLEQCRMPFSTLLRSTFLLRFQIFSEDIQQAYSESPDGEMDFEKLFLILAMRLQTFITLNTMRSFKKSPDFNPFQDTFQITGLKECLSGYYVAISRVFETE